LGKVTIYTAPLCPHSANLKNFLSELGIEYEEKNVLAGEEIMQEVFDKTQQMAIPVIMSGSEMYIGFDRRTERRLKRDLGV